jgi:hypothetical protein
VLPAGSTNRASQAGQEPEYRRLLAGNVASPGGNYRHTTSCDKAAECVFFVESSGKFDLEPVTPATSTARPTPRH